MTPSRAAALVLACILFVAVVAWRGAAEYLERVAEEHLWSGDPATAAAAFERAVRWDPLDPEPLVGLADAFFERGEAVELGEAAVTEDLEDAIETYRRAIDRSPDNAYAWAQLGRAYAALAVSRRASRDLDISAILSAGDLLEEEDAWAVAALQRSVELEPNNYDFINFVADLLDARGREDALEWYRRGTRTLPRLGLHPYLRNPNVPPEIVDAAVAGARDALGSGNVVPDDRILEEMALFLGRRGDTAGALAVNAEAIELVASLRADHPSLAWLWTRQGIWLHQLEDTSGARAAFERALELDPRRGSAHYSLGRLALDEGDPDQAVEHFRAARNALPTSLRFQMELARTLESADRLDEAAREYARALHLEGGGIPASMALVDLYRRQGIYDRAIEHAQRLVRLEPAEPAFREQLDELNARLQF